AAPTSPLCNRVHSFFVGGPWPDVHDPAGWAAGDLARSYSLQRPGFDVLLSAELPRPQASQLPPSVAAATQLHHTMTDTEGVRLVAVACDPMSETRRGKVQSKN